MEESNFFTDFLLGVADYKKEAKEHVLKECFSNERKLIFRANTLIDILIEKGIFTKEEFENRYYKQSTDFLIEVKEKAKREFDENKDSEDFLAKENNKLNTAIIEYIDGVFCEAKDNQNKNKKKESK